ncbi:MAG TPA: xylulokinase [Terrimicrobiaceae bacterium]|nr:xylulokinase [Terrimicrobiaceae bacterium]
MIFLGIDCGTQSTKTIALDWESGEVLASAHQAYGFVPDLPPGAMEQNPADWVDAADRTIAEVLAKLGPRKQDVRAIGVSGQQHGLVVLDENDAVVRPAKLWCDTSTTAQCEEITRHFGGPNAVIALVGNTMRPGYTAPKILWLRQNEPANWDKTRTVLLPHDYLNFWLTGEKRMEYGDASGTALLDVETRQWSAKVVDFVAEDLPDKLPPFLSAQESQGALREELRKKWGLSGNVTVSAGGGDNMMAAIGTGNIQKGSVTASLGTSGTLFGFSSTPVIDTQGEVAAFCDSTGNWLPLVCTMNVTLVTEHIRTMFGWDYAELERQILHTAPGADGLLLLPYLTGERTPDLPKGTGVFHGITLQNFTPAHMARSAMEGVTLGLGYGLSRFRDLGLSPTEIRLTGGGSNSAVWRQICADIFEVPVVCLRSGEGAGLGAAIQAGWVWNKEHGSDASLAEICGRLVLVDESTRMTPDSSLSGTYRALQKRSAGIREALHGVELL